MSPLTRSERADGNRRGSISRAAAFARPLAAAGGGGGIKGAATPRFEHGEGGHTDGQTDTRRVGTPPCPVCLCGDCVTRLALCSGHPPPLL